MSKYCDICSDLWYHFKTLLAIASFALQSDSNNNVESRRLRLWVSVTHCAAQKNKKKKKLDLMEVNKSTTRHFDPLSYWAHVILRSLYHQTAGVWYMQQSFIVMIFRFALRWPEAVFRHYETLLRWPFVCDLRDLLSREGLGVHWTLNT